MKTESPVATENGTRDNLLKYESYIDTHSGKQINFIDPHQEMIDINDIALGLSNACRWAGQIRPFYSVAQHSVLVSLIAPEELKPVALMHDTHESYTHDLAKPLKDLLLQPEMNEGEIVKKLRESQVRVQDEQGLHLQGWLSRAECMRLAADIMSLLRPGYNEICAGITQAIFAKYDLDYLAIRHIKKYDLEVQDAEYDYFFRKDSRALTALVRRRCADGPIIWDHRQAESAFLSAFASLVNKG